MEGFVEEKITHEAASQIPEIRTASAKEFNRVMTRESKNPAENIKIASKGKEGISRPSPPKKSPKMSVNKSEGAEMSSAIEEIDVNLESDESVAPKQSYDPKKLFIGGLNNFTQKPFLVEYFSKYGQVTNVTLPWNIKTGKNKGYGFIIFESAKGLQSALEEDHEIHGKKIDARADTAIGSRKREDSDQHGGNRINTFENEIYVGGLNLSTSEDTVKDHFSRFGDVVRIDLKHLPSESKGKAFVAFKEASSAKKALAASKQEIDSEKIVLGPRKPSRPNQLFLGGLNIFTQKHSLEQHFAKYGRVTNVTLPWNVRANQNKGYAFVSFESSESFQSALSQDHEIDGKKIDARAETTFGRKRNEDFDQPEMKPITTFDNELYVGGLNFVTSKKTVENHFSRFGELLKVNLPMMPQSSVNQGYAFVAFKETSAANEAMVDSNQEIDSANIYIGPKKPFHPNQLFVGGLNNLTQTHSLEKHFSKYGKVNHLTLPWNTQAAENMGYGFVSFEFATSLQMALEEDHVIDGKKIDVRDGTDSGSKKREDSKTSLNNELYVARLNLNTSKDMVKNHFSQFGEVVRVDLPMKYRSSESEGYAYVKFKEASSAKSALAVANQEIDSAKIFLGPKLPSHTKKLFVWGINHCTQTSTFEHHFSKYGKVNEVTFSCNAEAGENVGYGSVSFESDASLQSALREDHEIDGKKINVRAGGTAAGNKKRGDSGQPEEYQRTTLDNELFVSRLNLNTSKDTLKEHFSQFGEVVRVDLPMQFKSFLNKGYAFVAYKEVSSVKKTLADSYQEIDKTRVLIRIKQPYRKPSLSNRRFVCGLNNSTQEHTHEQRFSKNGKKSATNSVFSTVETYKEEDVSAAGKIEEYEENQKDEEEDTPIGQGA